MPENNKNNKKTIDNSNSEISKNNSIDNEKSKNNSAAEKEKKNKKDPFEYTPTDDNKKQKQKQASKKALKTAAKGAANYFGGPLGGKAVDVVAKTKAGQAILNKGAETLNRIPGIAKTTQKLDEKGAIDTLDKGMDLIGGGKNTPPTSGNDATENASKKTKDSTPEEGQDSPSNSLFSRKKRGKSILGDEAEGNTEEGQAKLSGIGFGNIPLPIKIVISIAAPFLIFIALILVIIASVTGTLSDYEDALGISEVTGGDTGGIEINSTDPEAQEFYERVNQVKLNYQSNGKTVDALKVVAVYHIIHINDGADYEDMTTYKIEQIADAMFDGNSYSESTFKSNLTYQIFASYFPNSTLEEREQMTEDVFDYIDRYYDFIGNDNANNTCASLGSCVYNIQGFNGASSGASSASSVTASDIQVRLMNCSDQGLGTPIEGEELVPFEKYIMGVVYAETGGLIHEDLYKAQAVAARSFSLTRATIMGGAGGTKFSEENGQWILQIRNCTEDQVYCDPDQGCSNTTNPDDSGNSTTVYSGTSTKAYQYLGPLPQDHLLRRAVSEVMGEVAVDENGWVYTTPYVSTDQNKWYDWALSGMNYKQILMQHYSGVKDIQENTCNIDGSSTCTSEGTIAAGPYTNWKQYQGSWTNVMVGTSGQTIKDIGCLVTSIAMLIEKSGVATNIDGEFNPGTFVEYLNQHNGFAGGNLIWASVSNAAPSFVFQQKISVSGYSREQKLQRIKELLDQGYYVVAEVKGDTGQHWVAIDSVSNDTVKMMDPGSSSTNMWTEYAWQNTSALSYFKVG